MASPTRVAAPPLQLVEELCRSLDRAEVTSCHWKSTDALDRSASGENDLDLLVAEPDGLRFVEILHDLRFVEGIDPRPKRVPGVRHFYGLDRATMRLVDVHAHARMVLGDDATKNYRLPIEQTYLATTSRDGLFHVPLPEAEHAVFVVRMMLKHGSPEAIATGRGRLSVDETAELRHLAGGSDPATRWRSLAAIAPMLDGDLVQRCADSLRPGAPIRERWDAWRDLRRRLAPYARQPRVVDISLQVARRLAGRTRQVLGRRRRKRLAGRGRVIAVVGSDGSGKTTAVTGLVELVAPVFDTARIHMGKPPRSASWRLVRMWMHMGRRLELHGAAPPTAIMDPDAAPSRSRLLIEALTARDRRRAAIHAHRFAARGGIAICDRYPLEQLSVDGSRARRKERRGLAGWLAAFERRQYARIPAPDIVVVLAVPVGVAQARRPEADPTAIAARAREVLTAAWTPDVTEVDAARPREDVLADVVAAVWERL